MAVSNVERQLNLIIALLGTTYGHTKDYIREQVSGYQDSATTEAFERMFERDKNELRSRGIPVEAFISPGAFEDDPTLTRYRIPKDKYRLPEIRLSLAEAAVVSVAKRLWEQASLGGAAASALRKVNPHYAEGDAEPAVAFEPRLSATGPAFGTLLAAVTARQQVRFQYRGLGVEQAQWRTVYPWGLGRKFGHAYLVGYDVDRQAERTFRVDRIQGVVKTLGTVEAGEAVLKPAEFTVKAALDRLELPQEHEAQLRLRAGKALQLRDRVKLEESASLGEWELASFRYGSVPAAARELVAYGRNVVVEGPEELRQAVRAHFQQTLETIQATLPENVADIVSEETGTEKYSQTDSGGVKGSQKSQAAPRESASVRLQRLVDLVPFLTQNQGMHLDEIATEFSITTRQLEKDLELLMVSGLPGGMHGDLMDVTWEDGYVYISDAEELSEPIRLSMEEAATLLVGLDVVATLPGSRDRLTAASAMAKISDAAGIAVEDLSQVVSLELASADLEQRLALLREALSEKRQVEMDYLVPHRDEITHRVVDPVQLFSDDELWYLKAWCHSAEAERIFRVDRIRQIELGASIPQENRNAFPQELFARQEEAIAVTFAVAQGAEWFLDRYGAGNVTEIADDVWDYALTIHVARTDWVPPLMAQTAGKIRVVSPDSVVADVQEWCQDAVDLYR